MTTQDPELSAALGWPGGISDPVLDRVQLLRMVAALMQDKLWEDHRVRHLWDQAQEQAEPDISLCPQCNGPADNGFDRSFPPSPYLCTKCMAEPVEPVATLTAQRDALLEALKAAEPYLRHADVDYNVYVQCRAAIALVEGRVKAVEEGK